MDDPYKRKKYKEAEFGDNKTVTDPITGKTLHKDTSAAKSKYGSKWNEHTAQMVA